MMERRFVVRGLLTSAAGLTIYLAVVVLTTPNLPPATSISIALNINALLLTGLLPSLWLQGYLQAKVSASGCSVRKSTAVGASAGGSALASLVSFLPLTQVGCCGFWLYALSLIAGLGGGGLAFATALLEAPGALMWSGVAAVWAGNLYLYWRLRRVRKTGTHLESLT